MVWSYGGDPSSSPKDAVRFEIGDVDSEYSLLQDEEINYAITQESGTFAAAARCSEVLSRRFALQPNTTIGKTKIDGSAAAKLYADLASKLRSKSVVYNATIDSGVISDPIFTKGMHDDISS